MIGKFFYVALGRGGLVFFNSKFQVANYLANKTCHKNRKVGKLRQCCERRIVDLCIWSYILLLKLNISLHWNLC